jgi:hypothetical protein
MAKEIPIDGEQDVVLVLRDRDGNHDFLLHLPPFKGDNEEFPPEVGTGVAIAACLYYQDEEFTKFIGKKFRQYAKKYLGEMCPGEVKEK